MLILQQQKIKSMYQNDESSTGQIIGLLSLSESSLFRLPAFGLYTEEPQTSTTAKYW